MKDVKEIPAGWTLLYEEVSNNVYKVSLKANHGSIVELTGCNFENIVARCTESAKELDKHLRLT